MKDGRVDDKKQDKEPPVKPPYIEGEESISGSATEPEEDDDTLENAHEMGQQLDEDPEHPKEIDIARDIDKAEEEIREG